MPKFTVVVYLKGVAADHPSYNRLNLLMMQQGFSQVITGDGGRSYHLPPGTFDFEGEHPKEQVCVMARSAAEVLGVPFSILVTKVMSRAWFGLEPTVKQALG